MVKISMHDNIRNYVCIYSFFVAIIKEKKKNTAHTWITTWWPVTYNLLKLSELFCCFNITIREGLLFSSKTLITSILISTWNGFAISEELIILEEMNDKLLNKSQYAKKPEKKMLIAATWSYNMKTQKPSTGVMSLYTIRRFCFCLTCIKRKR